MPLTPTVNGKAPSRNTTTELDLYAAEFAKLVDRYVPSRGEAPSAWLLRLPNEAYQYYQEGILTFGSDARTPIQRRGRLYLIHTTLLFMWMSWGKERARERFQAHANEGTRRAASLVTLETYRRAGVLAHYEVDDWFSTPVVDWGVTLISGAVQSDRVSDPELRAALQADPTVHRSVKTLVSLGASEAVPSRGKLELESSSPSR